VSLVGAPARWPTPVDRDSFCEITGLADLPPELAHLRDGNRLTYWGNGTVLYQLRGRLVRYTTLWGVRPAGPDGDTHVAMARGSRAAVTVRHDAVFGRGPQVFLTPVSPSLKSAILGAVERHCRRWSERHPGYAATDHANRIHVHVPDAARTGHESHFASVLREFVTYVGDRSRIPAWERPNLLAKYAVTTRAVTLARAQPPRARQ
jgi:hypothetical protein